MDMVAVRHGIEIRRPCLTYMVNGEDIICSEVAGERLVKSTEIIGSRSLELSKNNAESFENINEVTQEKKRDCCQKWLRKNPLPIWPSLLKYS